MAPLKRSNVQGKLWQKDRCDCHWPMWSALGFFRWYGKKHGIFLLGGVGTRNKQSGGNKQGGGGFIRRSKSPINSKGGERERERFFFLGRFRYRPFFLPQSIVKWKTPNEGKPSDSRWWQLKHFFKSRSLG